MKKLLLLGASIAQIPFIKTAKKLGCYVGVVDYNKKARAIDYANEYFPCSLVDVDGVDRIVARFKPDGITCGASDVGVLTASLLCEKYGLPGLSPEIARNVKDKGAMIEAFRKYGVPHPEYLVLTDPAEPVALAYPLITKPVDKSGSRGINVARNAKELKAALEDSFAVSDVKRVIVEEYMRGPEVSVEILVQNGEPFILQVTDKLTTGEPHFIEIGHSQPSALPAEALEAIRKVAYDACKAVGVVDGCCHAEIILTDRGPKMVEIAGRLGGDFIATVLLPRSTGVDISAYEILRAIGEPKPFEAPEKPGKAAAVRFIEAQPGRLGSVSIDYSSESMVSVEELSLLCQSGRTYGSAVNNNDRFGYVIASGETPQEAVWHCETALAGIHICMQ